MPTDIKSFLVLVSLTVAFGKLFLKINTYKNIAVRLLCNPSCDLAA
jgi:hypothetical protein